MEDSMKELFKKNRVGLFHGINFKDYLNYIHLGGIACREDLINSTDKPYGYTEFKSDENDKKNNILKKTFGNLFDYNRYYWEINPETCFPSAYGPITILLDSSIWDFLQDPIFTQGTIGSEFENKQSPKPLNDEELRKCVENNKTSGIEVSCNNRLLPIDRFNKVIVDPITVEGLSLFDLVAQKSPEGINVIERENIDQKAIDLFPGLLQKAHLEIKNPQKRYAFSNWKEYFTDGTYCFIKNNFMNH